MMNEITYRIADGYAYRKESNPQWFLMGTKRVDIYKPIPQIGQKYMVVFYCDYDNTEYGENFPVEVTADNIAEITFHMNDTENDITEYVLIN